MVEDKEHLRMQEEVEELTQLAELALEKAHITMVITMINACALVLIVIFNLI